jgi:hypothetical protein
MRAREERVSSGSGKCKQWTCIRTDDDDCVRRRTAKGAQCHMSRADVPQIGGFENNHEVGGTIRMRREIRRCAQRKVAHVDSVLVVHDGRYAAVGEHAINQEACPRPTRVALPERIECATARGGRGAEHDHGKGRSRGCGGDVAPATRGCVANDPCIILQRSGQRVGQRRWKTGAVCIQRGKLPLLAQERETCWRHPWRTHWRYPGRHPPIAYCARRAAPAVASVHTRRDEREDRPFSAMNNKL